MAKNESINKTMFYYIEKLSQLVTITIKFVDDLMF